MDDAQSRGGSVAAVVSQLDTWLQTMRQPGGYGGPVVHWWESCLLYCGPMFDWRYEGILAGYVTLYERSGEQRWLERARVAAEDLVGGQLPDGSYRNSNFQFGAIERGTPHEAAADIGLLLLARALRQRGDAEAERYLAVAERNLNDYHLQRLWNGRGFLDQSWNSTLVENKNATIAEALLLLEDLTGRDLSRYTRAAGEVILSAQVRGDGPRAGGMIHLGSGRASLVTGYYTARCVSGLVSLYQRFSDARYLQAVIEAVPFLTRQVGSMGMYFGYYGDGQQARYPSWISPTGDVLRALLLASRICSVPGEAIDRLTSLLLGAQQPSGALPTGTGSARRGLAGPPPSRPDLRDVLPVVGWCDKAFRALAMLSDGAVESVPSMATHAPCSWKGIRCVYREEPDRLWLERQRDGRALYAWNKQEPFPSVYAL